MNKKTIGHAVIATTALGASNLFAAPPSADPRYEVLRDLMKAYVQGVVITECEGQPGFDFDAYRWEDYEIKGLEVVLFDILNHTANYCKPPELTGMHKAERSTTEI